MNEYRDYVLLTDLPTDEAWEKICFVACREAGKVLPEETVIGLYCKQIHPRQDAAGENTYRILVGWGAEGAPEYNGEATLRKCDGVVL